MFCNNCGQKIDDKAKFCNKCGAAVAVRETANQPIAGVQVNNNTNPYENNPQQVLNQSTDAFARQVATQQLPKQSSNNGFQNSCPPNYNQQSTNTKKGNTALIVVLCLLIAIIISAIIVIFLIIKPFDNKDATPETNTTTVTQNDNSNKSPNNDNTSTKTVSCVAANGATLSGTVRVKDGYVLPDSSSKSYSASEISALGLNDAEMCIAWNEPYARAGYHFKNSGLQAYFNSCSWYHDTGFTGTLNDTGGQNTNVIKNVAGSSSWKSLATY